MTTTKDNNNNASVESLAKGLLDPKTEINIDGLLVCFV